MRKQFKLFSDNEWALVDSQYSRSIRQEIEGLEADRLLNTSSEDLAQYLEKKYWLESPKLLEDQIQVDQNEIAIDTNAGQARYLNTRMPQQLVSGTEIVIEIPFSGNSYLFGVRPTTYSSRTPEGKATENNLICFKVSGVDLTEAAVQSQIKDNLALIRSYLGYLENDVERFNNRLPGSVRGIIESRRNKLLADRSLVGGLGYRLKQRADAGTFVAPEIRRKIAPAIPPASSSRYVSEPTLAIDDYEHILGVVQGMAKVMERSPSAFQNMDEESLRSHFLVQLNGHYEGQATGETFNYEGKTDILVRSNNKNIFIAECKFWTGAKNFGDTIDQLLSYTSWRDTKTALIIFNQNKDFSKILSSIKTATRTHPNFKQEIQGSTESVLRYRFSHRDDHNRELYLTVLAFDVPKND